MPQANDFFEITLKKAHLDWGGYRHSKSRNRIKHEGYLQIPASIARELNITNSNDKGNNNIYMCNSSDGIIVNQQLKATGCSSKGDIYAKQFSGKGNLKLLGGWFKAVNAVEGDRVKIEFISSNQILLTKI